MSLLLHLPFQGCERFSVWGPFFSWRAQGWTLEIDLSSCIELYMIQYKLCACFCIYILPYSLEVFNELLQFEILVLLMFNSNNVMGNFNNHSSAGSWKLNPHWLSWWKIIYGCVLGYMNLSPVNAGFPRQLLVWEALKALLRGLLISSIVGIK